MQQFCSGCQKEYKVDFEAGDDLLHCPDCLQKQKLTLPDDFFTAPKKSISPWWTLGFVLCFSGLVAQIYWVARHSIAQNPQQRVWVEKICQKLPCGLPDYKNLDELEILHGDFQLDNTHYLFETVISNQAQFAQAYPRIRLVLLDFSGQVFAQRIFYPSEYLGVSPTEKLAAAQTIEVSLKIAIPKQKVGGYTFELL